MKANRKRVRLSSALHGDFCVEALEDALAHFGSLEIFDTDQGTQFTGAAFTDVLKGAEVAIGRDGKGRWVDNVFVERLWRSVKYEEVNLSQNRIPLHLRNQTEFGRHENQWVAIMLRRSMTPYGDFEIGSCIYTPARTWPQLARDWAAPSGSITPSAAIMAWGAGHPMRCMLTAIHGPRQREAGEPQGRRTLIDLSNHRGPLLGSSSGCACEDSFCGKQSVYIPQITLCVPFIFNKLREYAPEIGPEADM